MSNEPDLLSDGDVHITYTVRVTAWIVITLLRWIGRLAYFGRVGDTIKRVEKKAAEALKSYPGPRLLAGRADIDIPADASIVAAAA